MLLIKSLALWYDINIYLTIIVKYFNDIII